MQRGEAGGSPWCYARAQELGHRGVTEAREGVKYHPHWRYIIYEWPHIRFSLLIVLAPFHSSENLDYKRLIKITLRLNICDKVKS